MNNARSQLRVKNSTPSFTPARSVFLQRKCACGGTPGLTGECEACRRKRESKMLQRAPAPRSSASTDPFAVPPIVHEVVRAPGRPLDAKTREFMEPRFGHDFSGVRVHVGERAAESAQSLNASAYTIGQQIIFASGQYSPDTTAGKELLAHELAHVVQQSRASFSASLTVDSNSSSDLENDAREQARRVLSFGEAENSPGAKSTLSTVRPKNTSSARAPTLKLQRAALTPAPPDLIFWKQWGSEIDKLRRMFQEQRYGCWCGPGNPCTEIRDNIDACCRSHDLAYEKVAVSSAIAPGKVDMWSIEGFRRTLDADLALVFCTQATKLDLHFYGPAAALYREAVAIIFGTRAAIALWILTNIPLALGSMISAPPPASEPAPKGK